MEQASADRRRGRRVSLEAPLLVRRAGAGEPGPFTEQTAKNLSLAGVYFETEGNEPYAINETLITAVAIPEPERRAFPFTRLFGRSRVVRVDEIPQPPAGGAKRYGVALEFSEDVTALTATPPRG